MISKAFCCRLRFKKTEWKKKTRTTKFVQKGKTTQQVIRETALQTTQASSLTESCESQSDSLPAPSWGGGGVLQRMKCLKKISVYTYTPKCFKCSLKFLSLNRFPFLLLTPSQLKKKRKQSETPQKNLKAPRP